MRDHAIDLALFACLPLAELLRVPDFNCSGLNDNREEVVLRKDCWGALGNLLVFFLWLINISLNECTAIYLSIHLPMVIGIDGAFSFLKLIGSY